MATLAAGNATAALFGPCQAYVGAIRRSGTAISRAPGGGGGAEVPLRRRSRRSCQRARAGWLLPAAAGTVGGSARMRPAAARPKRQIRRRLATRSSSRRHRKRARTCRGGRCQRRRLQWRLWRQQHRRRRVRTMRSDWGRRRPTVRADGEGGLSRTGPHRQHASPPHRTPALLMRLSHPRAPRTPLPPVRTPPPPLPDAPLPMTNGLGVHFYTPMCGRTLPLPVAPRPPL